jgi:hypothetical protein
VTEPTAVVRPQSPLRTFYDALHALDESELTAIAEAHARDPGPLVRRFTKSVQVNDLVTKEPFHSGHRADPGEARDAGEVNSTIKFVARLSDGTKQAVMERPDLAFRYVDREISPLRTTGTGRSARRSLDLLLVNANDGLPILAELKIAADKPSYSALVQILALAADLVTQPQLQRLRTHYPDGGFTWPDSGPYVDLYVIAHEVPARGKYRATLLDATRAIVAKLNTDPGFTTSVRRIAYLTSAANDGQLTFTEPASMSRRQKPAALSPSGGAHEALDLTHVLAHVRAVLGDAEGWSAPTTYQGVAVALIDSIWSIGVRYSGVLNVVERYRRLRSEQEADADRDDPVQLIAVIERCGGPADFAEQVRNRQRTSSRSGILKADAVLRAALVLRELHITTPADLQAAAAEDLDALRSRWRAIPGQGSGISLNYFLMLCGMPGVKGDRMIRRFVASALGDANELAVDPARAVALVQAAATRLDVSDRTLDLAIWQHESEQAQAS